MTDPERQQAFELYAMGMLEEPERTEVEEAIRRGDEETLEILRLALSTNASLGLLAPRVEPPRRLRSRVLASVGVEKTGWSRVLPWVAVTAALLVGVLALNQRNQNTLDQVAALRLELERSSADRTRIEAALRFLQEPETRLVGAGGAVALPSRARVFLNRSRGVLLAVHSLAPAAPGRIYEMWLIPKRGQPRPAGLFQTDADGNGIHIQAGPIDLDQTRAVAVTEEPETGSPQPTSTPIIVSAL